jgi:hypothetical protein
VARTTPQKFELLLHTFFARSCLNFDIFDENGKRFTPREWFVVPLNLIDEAIQLLLNGEIIYYKYDAMNERIISKES